MSSPGSALFDGYSSFLYRTNPPLLSPGAGPFSVAALVNHRHVTALGQGIVQKYSGIGNQKEYGLQLLAAQFGGGWKFILSPDGLANDGPQVSPPGGIQPNTTYLVCGTFAPNDARISYNAGPQVQYTAFASLFQGTADFTLGQLVGTSNTIWMDGLIARVGYWSRVLSPVTDIPNLYNAGVSFQFSTLPASLLTGLVGWWDLGEAAGTTRLDSTANHLNLTDRWAGFGTVGAVGGPP